MKLNLTTIFSLITIINLWGQELTIKEPEWQGNVLYVDSTNEGVKLEMQKSYLKTKAGASMYVVGVGKIKSKSHVNGVTSNLLIPRTENLQFIVKNSTNEVDPSSLINIFPLERGTKTRFVEVASTGTFSGAENMNINYVSFSAKKYGESSYLITIPKIKNGEYAITLANTSGDFNLFTVGIPVKPSSEEIIRTTVKEGDIVYFKRNGEYIEGVAKEHQYYGLKLVYKYKGKDRNKVVPYNLISLENK